MIGIAEVKTM